MSSVVIGKVHTDDKGTIFRLNVFETQSDDSTNILDLSPGGTTAFIIFTNPSNEEFEFSATIIAPATSGIIEYINTDTTFFNDSSFWFYRARIDMTNTSFQSNDISFEVLDGQQ